MDEFSYLSVLLSIILGLAVTEVLQGFRRLLQSRARVRLYWPTLAWAVLLLVIYVQSWWAMFGLRAHQDWTFAGFAIVLLQTITLYMLASLVLPEFSGDEEVDLRAHYYAQHRWFFGFAAANGMVSLAKDLVLYGRLPEAANLAFHLVFLVGALIGAITRRESYHKTAVVFGAGGFALYIAFLFTRLR